MIWTNILQGGKYGVVQTVSPISRDFLFLAINFAISDYAEVTKTSLVRFHLSARRLLKLASSARALS